MVPRWRGIGGVAVGVRDRDGSTCNGRGAWGAERGAVEPWKGGIERARREGNNRGSAQQCDLGITQRSSVDKGEEDHGTSIDVRNSASFVKLPRIGLNIGNIVMSAKPNSGSSSETTQGESCTVGEKDGVIIVDHGSRREESNLMLTEPAIKDAFGKCVQQGASRVIVSPYFLSPGRHWKQDIPALAAEASKEHSNIPYIVTAPLGLHELMVDVMNDRIKYCLRHVAGDVEECTVCAGTGKCHLYP
uniref:Sirohydrochlorin cobaltochelatase n=1 Tax=Oryza punctata TaxID=4537 RepID=A0A0E0JYR8_ORYPU